MRHALYAKLNSERAVAIHRWPKIPANDSTEGELLHVYEKTRNSNLSPYNLLGIGKLRGSGTKDASSQKTLVVCRKKIQMFTDAVGVSDGSVAE